METLPAVAKSVYTFCKKCDAERYHVVLAHKSEKSAKVKCEICGAQKTYSIGKDGKETKPKRAVNPGGLSAKATQAKNAHTDEYSKLIESAKNNTVGYNMKTKYNAQQKVQHPKFGLGYVRSVQPEKIEVIFADEVRQLVHNRV